MVARGDLGVEIDVARMPMVQKQIVAMCHRYQRPVICATQMLDSMQHNKRPTRAEVTDVANAILDGCDATMLSGETAIGDYPRLTVEMMKRIAAATEVQFMGKSLLPMRINCPKDCFLSHRQLCAGPTALRRNSTRESSLRQASQA